MKQRSYVVQKPESCSLSHMLSIFKVTLKVLQSYQRRVKLYLKGGGVEEVQSLFLKLVLCFLLSGLQLMACWNIFPFVLFIPSFQNQPKMSFYSFAKGRKFSTNVSRNTKLF